MKKKTVFYTSWKLVITLLIFLCSQTLYAQSISTPDKPMKYWSQQEFEKWERQEHRNQLLKSAGAADRREGVMDGNKIRTVYYNYGSIGRPNTEPSIEWPKESNNGYAYEFGPILGAQVADIHGEEVAIFSEALIDGGDRAPGGKVWGWQPLPQYLNTNSLTPAMSDDPESWPQTISVSNPFYNINATSDADRFLWPGVDTLGQISGDLEAYWLMDDRDNDEFEYYPFINDSSRRGLGLELKCRLMQFSATLAEDIIFYIIEIKNVSDKRLEKVVAGMFGDPHIGGPGDFGDDYAGFDPITNMVYSWDKPESGNDYSLPWADLGWLGFKFLESPKDSAGKELGLTSMAAPVYATTAGSPSVDDIMWAQLTPGKFTEISQEKDNVFLFGSGYFSLDPGETQQFSIAILMGKGLDELNANGAIAQEIYNLKYKFTKAPDPPKVTAVPGDGEVTLYWDSGSEGSYDEFFQSKDFEGYKIYRSTDKGQTWGRVITNAYGQEVGYIPVKQFDLQNDVDGLFPFDKDGIKFYLGKNTGLAHTFKDINVINGVTYYYAVTAYDSGYISKGVHPVESGKFLGKNMVAVMPKQRVAGFENASIKIEHPAGISTTKIIATVLDEQVIAGHTYEVTFDDTSGAIKTCTITDQDNDKIVIDQSKELSGLPIIFDGLIANIYDETIILSIDSLTGWKAGSKSTLDATVALFSPGGVRYGRDIEIKFFDTIKDTSVLSGAQPIKFEVWNVTESIKMDVYFIDSDKNHEVTLGDKIVPIIYVNKKAKGTWEVAFNKLSAQDTINPTSGDTYRIVTSKPLTNDDVYRIQTEPATIDASRVKSDFMAEVAVVPNPYIASSSFETPPPSVFSAGRGERRVFFIHLPQKCTIRIYTTNGELIRTLEHNGTIFNGTEPWDLLSSEGLDIAYGIYVYHIDAWGYGEKVGKFAIIK